MAKNLALLLLATLLFLPRLGISQPATLDPDGWIMRIPQLELTGSNERYAVSLQFLPDGTLKFLSIEELTARDRDDDGDGYSESQGDCDDEDPRINPSGEEACAAACLGKIHFDLDSLNAAGLYGPPNGLRALDYEFCIPAGDVAADHVRSIDPSIVIHPDSRGRVGCGEDEFLCIGNTHQSGFREILCRLAALSYVEKILQVFWE